MTNLTLDNAIFLVNPVSGKLSLNKKINIINKKTLIKSTRGKKVKKKGFKKAIITLKKGQNIDLTTGI